MSTTTTSSSHVSKKSGKAKNAKKGSNRRQDKYVNSSSLPSRPHPHLNITGLLALAATEPVHKQFEAALPPYYLNALHLFARCMSYERQHQCINERPLTKPLPVSLHHHTRTCRPLSAAMQEASQHVKDFMTENQKALAYLKVGKQLSDRGVFRGALECYTEGISNNPSATLFNARAQAYKSLNMWSEAYFDYSYAIRIEPGPASAGYYCSRGMVLGKMKCVNPTCVCAVSVLPGACGGMVACTSLCCTIHILHVAVFCPHTGILLTRTPLPCLSLSLFFLPPLVPLYLFSFLRRFVPAIEDCDTAVGLQSTPFHHYCKATIHADAEQNDLALLDLQSCLNFNACPTDLRHKALYRHALCHFELRHCESCIKDCTTLLDSDPNSTAPRALLARALKLQNDFLQADEQISLCVSSDSKNPSYFVERGDIRFRTGDKYKTADAVHDFDSAIYLLSSTVQQTISDLAIYAHEAATWNKEPEQPARDTSGWGGDNNDNSGGGIDFNLTSGYELGRTGPGKHTDKFRSEVANAAAAATTSTTSAAGLADEGQRRNDGNSSSYSCVSCGDGTAVSAAGFSLDSPSAALESKTGDGEDQFSAATATASGEFDHNDTGARGDDADSRVSFSNNAGAGAGMNLSLQNPGIMPSVSPHGQMKKQHGASSPGTGGRTGAAGAGVAVPFNKKKQRMEQQNLEEQQAALADAYFRRSQCKMLLANEKDETVLLQALDDATNATHYSPDDDDYQLAVATCHIKLRRFEDAMESFKIVTRRSPKNEKALYQFAFCQRAVGRHRDAIEGLTKIIAVANDAHKRAMAGEVDADYHMIIPLERIYETRGTMFHEIHAHKLALADLGRAIALNPDRPENYYLRGDCHAKLGNYELALSDYNLADETGFSDMCSLTSARGMTKRMCGDSSGAREDFEVALELLKELTSRGVDGGGVGLHTDSYNTEDAAILGIRLASLRALCFLDIGLYNAGHDILMNTNALVSELIVFLLDGKTITDCLLVLEEAAEKAERKEKRARVLRDARRNDAAAQRNAAKTMRAKELAAESAAALETLEEQFRCEEEAEQKEEADKELAEKERNCLLEGDSGYSASGNGNGTNTVFEPIIDEVAISSMRRLQWVLLYVSHVIFHVCVCPSLPIACAFSRPTNTNTNTHRLPPDSH